MVSWQAKLIILSIVAVAINLRSARAADNLGDVLGVVHINGQYSFGPSDFLDQGADQVLATGSRVIKLEMGTAYATKYQWNCDWPKCSTLTELAKTPYFKSVFGKPFKTYIITTYSLSIPGASRTDEYWLKGITPEQEAAETQSFYDLCRYLMQIYNGTGKTFIFEQWEGDWALRSGGAEPRKSKPTQTNVRGMIDWINAREAGIQKARKELGAHSDVKVFGCLEVNLVANAMDPKFDWPTVTNDVLPHTNVDYASYSSYDTMGNPSETNGFPAAVRYIVSKLPASAVNGRSTRSVYVGEFGVAEGRKSPAEVNAVMNNVIGTTIKLGMPYACYWEIYSNELARNAPPPPENGNNAGVKGFFMVKPDGTPSTAWHQYRQRIITSDPARAATDAIVKGLNNVYTSDFSSSDAGTENLGKGWTIDTSGGSFQILAHAGHVKMTPTKSGAAHGTATLDIPAVAGRSLHPGDYIQLTLQRQQGAGTVGVWLFGLNHGSGSAAGEQPLEVESNHAWTPVSFALDGSHPAYDWSQPHTLGLRLDTADGTFATVSFYLDGKYAGSWIYRTEEKELNRIGLFAQSATENAAFQFEDVRIYLAK